MAKSHKKSVRRLIIILALLLLAGCIGYAAYHYSNKKPSKNLAISDSTTKPKAAQSSPTTPSVPSSGNLTPGGVVDNNGQASQSLPPSSDWVSSASGLITLQQPSSGSNLSSGSTISGTTSLGDVSFILTDNSVGQIDQGTLNVVNGKFSGLMQFQAHSSSGTLEVYYANPSNGGEEDVIKIDVNFSS